MNINTSNVKVNTVELKNINSGDCFKYADAIYMKTRHMNRKTDSVMCVNVTNGETIDILRVIEVIPVKAEINVFCIG